MKNLIIPIAEKYMQIFILMTEICLEYLNWKRFMNL